MGEPRYQVRISSEAHASILEQVAFLANVSVPAAKKLKERLLSHIRLLETEPFRFRSLDENNPHDAYRLMLVPKWYGVIYLVQGAEVFVELVIDLRSDHKWLLDRFHAPDDDSSVSS